MYFIGITGGVGCGKSEVLRYLEKTYNCRILLTDDLARKMEEPGGVLFEPLKDLLAKAEIDGDGNLLQEDGKFNNKEFARRLFRDDTLRDKVNALVHPAVKDAVRIEGEREAEAGEKEFFFVEAALLIESGFDEILDEIWYVFCPEEERRRRLRESRGYSDEKIDSIMSSQCTEAEFRSHCRRVIENDGTLEEMMVSVDRVIEEIREEKG